jgi:hypothetical protein
MGRQRPVASSETGRSAGLVEPGHRCFWLGLSMVTVRHPASAITGKMRASSRTEAVALALMSGKL